MAVTQVTISKGGVKYTVEVDTDKITDQGTYEAIFVAGLEVMLAKKMSKITKKDIPNEKERLGNVKAQADENLQGLYEGRLPTRGKAKTAKVSGKVNTEAMRIARQMVKDLMKANGLKVSHYDAKEITAAAKEVLENDPSIIELAKSNIEQAEAAKNAATEKGVDLSAIAKSIKINPKKKADQEAKAAERKATAALSAKQAGMVQTRIKGQGKHA